MALSRALYQLCRPTSCLASRLLRPLVIPQATWSTSTQCRPLTASAAPHTATTGEEFSSRPGVETHEFRAETRRLLGIVAHSLYTDKEVFVRELVSNASDSLEKLRFLQATGQLTTVVDAEAPLEIEIEGDAAAKTFSIRDTGVGMNRDELITNLGTIAKSGSLAFLEQAAAKDKANAIVGQFGVGFYSAFVVSDHVDVYSRSAEPDKADQGWKWSSDGLGTYSIEPCEGLPRGTKVVCHLKSDCLEFANRPALKNAASKFSAFVSFPLYLKKSEAVNEGEAKGEERETITTQEALWLKSNPTNEEHTQFFRYLSGQSYGEPLYALQYNADAPLCLRSILYIPSEAPNRMFMKGIEVGVSLHSRRILVKKNAEEVVPRWLFFVQGVVDCEDVPLNISRENMQDSKLMEKLSVSVVRRLLRFLHEKSKEDVTTYTQKFYPQFSYHLKEGVLEDLQSGGQHKEDLLRLLRFQSNRKEAKELISLEDYVSNLSKPKQRIYYLCASSRDAALASPYMEKFGADSTREVLLFLEDVDEFLAMHLKDFKGHRLVAVDAPDNEMEDEDEEEEEEEVKEKKAESKVGLEGPQRDEVQKLVKEYLGRKVTEVKFSERLTNSPAIVTGFMSPALRRMMKATMRGSMEGNALDLSTLPVTLELNPHHEVITSLYHLKDAAPDLAKLVVEQLLDNACIAAGILDDPKTMLGRLNGLLKMTSQYAYHYSKAVSEERAEPLPEKNKEVVQQAEKLT